MKTCPTCNTPKDERSFYKDPQCRDGLRSSCRGCDIKISRAKRAPVDCLVCKKPFFPHKITQYCCSESCYRKKANEARREQRAANPEFFRAQDKERYVTYKSTSVRQYHYKTKYGLSLENVHRMFARQHGKCLGCQNPMTLPGGKQGEPCCVDHNHETGVVRGLLCHTCNRSLGLVKESPETLRRLSSYLHYDRTKLGVYIIGSLRNPKVPEVGNALRAAGFDAMDDWYGSGEKADDAWQEYEKARGRTYAEALKGRAAESIYCFDRSLLDLADAAVLVAPGGRSAFLELGYFVGCGKPGYILDDGDPARRFEVMPNFATAVITDLDLLTARLRGLAETIL